MSADYSWLAELCETDLPRPVTRAPFALEWNLRMVTVATNGRVLLAVPGELAAPATDDQRAAMASLGRSMPSSEPRGFSFAEFRAFLGLPADPIDPCATCRGRGTLDCDACEGEGDAECECHCGDVHSRICPVCKGSGRAPCPACGGPRDDLGTDPVRLFGVFFDRRILVPAISRLAADTVTWQNDDPRGAAIIRSDTWWLAVMPLRCEPLLPKYENAPSFGLTLEATA